MKIKTFQFYLIAILGMVMGLQQPALNAKCSSHERSSSFTHTFNLSTMDSTYLINGTPTVSIDSTVETVVKGKKTRVILTIPSFTFTVPVSSLTPLDGYAYTIPTSNLPQSVWHSRGLPHTIPCGSNTTLYVFNDGAIVIGGANFAPLIAGTYVVNQTTISYELDRVLGIPQNFEISSTIYDSTTNTTTDDLLDFYNNDYYGDVIAYTWAANPADQVTNPANLNFYAAVGSVKHGKVTIGETKALFIPNNQAQPQECFENTISINPTNKMNLVATCNFRNANFTVPDPTFNHFSFLRSYTFDGGQTWHTDQMTGSNRTAGFGLAEFRSDTNALFDEFGNHWIAYLTAGTPDLLFPFEVTFVVSVDGGVTYTTVGTTALGAFLDYPRLSFGGDGQGGRALWFSVDLLDSVTEFVSDVVVGYIPVSGLGSYGTLTYDLATGLGKDVATDSICYIDVPEITATPSGDVYLYAPTQLFNGDNGNYGKNVLARHTGGIVNFNSFMTPTDLMVSNVADNNFNTNAFGKAIPWQADRGVFGGAARGIDYDPISKRLWIGGVNMKPNNFSPTVDTSNPYNMTIFSMYSNDNGRTWSAENQVSDADVYPRALPSIKVNKKNGRVAFFWYDSRNDSTGLTAQPFGAITGIRRCK